MYIELWKWIPGWEGLYMVSTHGRVKSLKHNKSKILKPWIDKDGYKRVRLCKNGKCKTYGIHRLVAMAFIPNPHNYPIINHKDENKTNNQYTNLEWCTIQYNSNYGTINERRSGANNHFYGKHHTEESKRKISNSKKSR